MAIILDGDGIKSDVEIKKSTTTGLSVVENITRFPNRPTFSAHRTTSGTTTVGSTIVYPDVSVNVGNCYNSSNGIFTAPVAGVYEFSWGSIGNKTTDVYRFGFRVNGAQYVADFHLRLDTQFTGNEYGENTAYTLIVPLQANDNVSILFFQGSTLFYTASDNWYNYFNGWLIK